VVAIVDNVDLNCRDFVRVVKLDFYDIIIGVRGCTFGNVSLFQRKEDTEANLFIKECERLNLEWITA